MFPTLAEDEAHPLLDREVVDRLRVVHDVFGHAALGLRAKLPPAELLAA